MLPQGALINKNAQPVPGVKLKPEQSWITATSGTPGAKTVNVVSDGNTVYVVDGDKVLWNYELPKNSPLLNGFSPSRETSSTPSIIVGDAIVLATPDYVIGLDLETGKTLWKVPGKIRSWSFDGTKLIVKTEKTLAILDFTPNPTAGSADHAASAPPASINEPTTTGAATSLEDLKNATLKVPPGCRKFGLEYGRDLPDSEATRDVRFIDGTATSSLNPDGWVKLNDAKPGLFDGKPATVVVFNCFAGGTHVIDALGVYDSSSLEFIAAFEGRSPDDETRLVQGTYRDFHIQDLSVVGSTIKFKGPGVRLIGDDENRRHTPVSIEMTWNGKGLSPDIVYHTATGDIRTPKLADVEKIFKDIVNSNDQAAMPYVVEQAKKSLEYGLDNIPLGDRRTSPYNMRNVHFNPDNYIPGCTLIDSDGMPLFKDPKTGQYGGRRNQFSGDGDVIRVGDTICPVGSTHDYPKYNDPDRRVYAMWILLRGTEDGSVQMYQFGRDFS